MGIKPIISRTRMGRRSEEIGHTQGISCLSLSSSKPTRSQLTTLGTKEEESLVLEGSSHQFFVQLESSGQEKATPPGWMDIKFCKTNLLIEHKELDGRFQFKPPVYTLVGHEADLQEEEIELDRAEDRAEIKLKMESRKALTWVSLSAITLRSMRLQG
ncbi:unnamed protein product [Microthlaspi erraticum]|uniref:Uncharacterized protein n=1 Tax=Microthlaspi erraticum TaxID=1685480 RepID=A0A6D2JVI9_9BRAS|nr:unnamed protein product [Microthlaspi erraticum]